VGLPPEAAPENLGELLAGARVALLGLQQRQEGSRLWLELRGPRETLRSPFALAAESLGADQAVGWIRWLQGRWPRGDLILRVTLAGAPQTLELGLDAPLNPTRLALSASPLPFPKPSVDHARTLHTQTGAPTLCGFRLRVEAGKPTQVRLHWRIQNPRLPAVLACWQLALPAQVQAWTAQAGAMVLEAPYDPTPIPRPTLFMAAPPDTDPALALGQSLRRLAQTEPSCRPCGLGIVVDVQGIAAVSRALVIAPGSAG
jgi:hypothetical protein